jgi:hypothetical protein
VRDGLYIVGLCRTYVPVVARSVILFKSFAIVSDEVFAVLYCNSCDGRCCSSAITPFSMSVLYKHTTIVSSAFQET